MRQHTFTNSLSLGHMWPQGWLSSDTNVGMARKKSTNKKQLQTKINNYITWTLSWAQPLSAVLCHKDPLRLSYTNYRLKVWGLKEVMITLGGVVDGNDSLARKSGGQC